MGQETVMNNQKNTHFCMGLVISEQEEDITSSEAPCSILVSAPDLKVKK
jgi:hypothetical protein